MITDNFQSCSQEINSNQEFSQTNEIKSKVNPIIAGVTKDGAQANINSLTSDNTVFELIGKGFKPNESLNLISRSYHEILYSPITVDENGCLPPIMLQPAVIGKSGGICNIDLLRKEGSLRIQFPWGIPK